MKLQELNIRDPFVLRAHDQYYLYGTRAATTWTCADGFDVYTSEDMQEWSGPVEIFHKPEGFWADRNYWAPECVYYQNRYYLVVTLGAEGHKGIQIMSCDKPDGTFVPLTRMPITPEDWACLDGSLYFEDEHPVLLFSHSVPEENRGAICRMLLSDDLSAPLGNPDVLFYAQDCSWAKPIPFAQQEFGVEGDAYFSDGPYLFHDCAGALCMLWSSWGEGGYCMGLSRSASGKTQGPWLHDAKPFVKGGGRGMVFTDSDGISYLIYHSPNDFGNEHPVFVRVSFQEKNMYI